MEAFLDSLQKESREYRLSTEAVDENAQYLREKYQDLKSNVNTRVFSKPRPGTVVFVQKKDPGSVTPRRTQSQATELKKKNTGQTRSKSRLVPQTSRKPDSEQDNYRWITSGPATSRNRGTSSNVSEFVMPSSHHFQATFNDSRRPKTPRPLPKSPRWYRPHTDDYDFD